MSSWLNFLAIVISIISLAVSIYVMIQNGKHLLAKTRSDLLVLIQETRVRYGELNRRNLRIAESLTRVPAQFMDRLVDYRQYEKNMDRYYDEIKETNYTAAELEDYRSSIQSMLVHIAADMKQIDEWEQGGDESNGKQ